MARRVLNGAGQPFRTLSMTFDPASIFAALLAGFLLSFAMSQLFRTMLDGNEAPEGSSRVLAIGLMFLAGPHILAAAAQKLTRFGEWPVGYAVGCYVLSAGWAGVLGFCFLSVLRGS
jgi:hypothetical protein